MLRSSFAVSIHRLVIRLPVELQPLSGSSLILPSRLCLSQSINLYVTCTASPAMKPTPSLRAPTIVPAVTIMITYRRIRCSLLSVFILFPSFSPSPSPPSSRSASPPLLALSHRSLAPSPLTLSPILINSSPARKTNNPLTPAGNSSHHHCTYSLNPSPNTTLSVPSKITLAPDLAPNRHCAASPPLP